MDDVHSVRILVDGGSDDDNSGELSNYIQITNYEELSAVRNALDKNYILANDITVPADYNFMPIGTFESPFTGTFDGKNYNIVNLRIENTTSGLSTGLFGAIRAGGKDVVSVKNLILRNIVITSISGTVGSIVGYLYTGTIKNVIVIEGSVSAGNDYVGGLAGRVSEDGILFGGSSIAVSGNGASYVGGLAGSNSGYLEGFSRGDVVGVDHVGGLAGGNYGIVIGYSRGDISGESAGGLIGWNDLLDGDFVVGYATGSISLTVTPDPNYASRIGGVIGASNGDQPMVLYWDTATTGQSRAIGITLVAPSVTNLTEAGFSISDVSWDTGTGVYKTSGNLSVFTETKFAEYFQVTESSPGDGNWPVLKVRE